MLFQTTLYGGKKIAVSADSIKEARRKVFELTNGAVMRHTKAIDDPRCECGHLKSAHYKLKGHCDGYGNPHGGATCWCRRFKRQLKKTSSPKE